MNHGISGSLLDEVRWVGREFFNLPMEEKKKVGKGVKEMNGYGGDPVPEEGQSLDWSDRLFLDVYPEHTRKFEFWPSNPPSFRYFKTKWKIEKCYFSPLFFILNFILVLCISDILNWSFML